MNLYRNSFNSGVLQIQDSEKLQCFQKRLMMLFNISFVLEGGCGNSGKEEKQKPIIW